MKQESLGLNLGQRGDGGRRIYRINNKKQRVGRTRDGTPPHPQNKCQSSKNEATSEKKGKDRGDLGGRTKRKIKKYTE